MFVDMQQGESVPWAQGSRRQANNEWAIHSKVNCYLNQKRAVDSVVTMSGVGGVRRRIVREGGFEYLK